MLESWEGTCHVVLDSTTSLKSHCPPSLTPSQCPQFSPRGHGSQQLHPTDMPPALSIPQSLRLSACTHVWGPPAPPHALQVITPGPLHVPSAAGMNFLQRATLQKSALLSSSKVTSGFLSQQATQLRV